MGNGALGDAGLHAEIKSAYDALFERQSDTGLINVLEEKIRSEVDATLRFFEISTATEVTADLAWAPPGVPYVPGSLISRSDEVLTQTITVERAPGSTPIYELVLGRFGPELEFLGNFETDASFRVRYNAAIDDATARMTDDAMVSLGMYTLIDAIEAETVHLVNGGSEVVLRASDNDHQATNVADYVIGNDGDDRIEGLGGPDALVGGRGNDVLIGGNWTDALTGGPGSDMLFGATIGQTNTVIDTAIFDGNSREYTIEGGRAYATVTHADGTRDKLFDIDVVRFDDGFVELGEGNALDGAGDIEDFTIPEIVALLYAAALDRSNTDDDPNNNLDRGGLNFYIDAMEDGFGVVALAGNLMTSPEFTENFGDVDTLSNEEFVDRVYQNVLDRVPEQRGRDFYIAELSERGQTKAQVLADIAISPENASEAQATLMSLYETSTPEVRVLPNISIDLDWVFVS